MTRDDAATEEGRTLVAIHRIDSLLGWPPIHRWWDVVQELARLGHSLGTIVARIGEARRRQLDEAAALCAYRRAPARATLRGGRLRGVP